jgi:hypothetical protein
VKSLRVWLLVLLAFALPLRSAMAAAMLCAPASGHVHAAASSDGGHGQGHHHAGHAVAQDVHPHAAYDPASDADHGTGDKCSFCASCCPATAPVPVTLAMPQAPPAAAGFPEHRAPSAEFVSGGQDRPPRTI